MTRQGFWKIILIKNDPFANATKQVDDVFLESGQAAPYPEHGNPGIVATQFSPNPFNQESVIELSIAPENVGKPISFEIVNILGQHVWRETSDFFGIWDKTKKPNSSGFIYRNYQIARKV